VIFHAGNRRCLIPGWFWIFLIGFPLGVIAWWFLRWFMQPTHERSTSVVIDAPRSDGKKLPLQRDDFRILKGIGPKSAAVLYQAGIFSFEQLGLMDTENLESILKEKGLPSGGAAFWQKQAKLAAAENWKLLEKLQK
jgi:hypothetical protein